LKHGVLTVTGTTSDDTIELGLEAGQPDVLQVDVGDGRKHPFHVKRKNIDSIYVDAGDGNDAVSVDEANGVFTDTIATTLDGGDGNDTLAGGSGSELLLGSGGDDSIDGNGGADTALMGSGDDTFIWDPGDGSDIVEGQDGNDRMVFNGAAAAEQVDVSANGSRLKFFRNPGNITMDTASVETVDFNALGGTDTIMVNDLSGTGVSKVNLDLAAAPGGTAGDGQADRISVNGTAGNDAIAVSGDAAGVSVTGLAASIGIRHAEGANDRLEVNTLAGSDTVSSGGLGAGLILLFVDGVLVQ
jgi:Ca2+-binding RTX toxin-like protein